MSAQSGRADKLFNKLYNGSLSLHCTNEHQAGLPCRQELLYLIVAYRQMYWPDRIECLFQAKIG